MTGLPGAGGFPVGGAVKTGGGGKVAFWLGMQDHKVVS